MMHSYANMRLNEAIRSMFLHILTYIDLLFPFFKHTCHLGGNKLLEYDLIITNHLLLHNRHQIDEKSWNTKDEKHQKSHFLLLDGIFTDLV